MLEPCTNPAVPGEPGCTGCLGHPLGFTFGPSGAARRVKSAAAVPGVGFGCLTKAETERVENVLELPLSVSILHLAYPDRERGRRCMLMHHGIGRPFRPRAHTYCPHISPAAPCRFRVLQGL